MNLICTYCNNSFDSKTSTKRFCSTKCKNDDRKIQIELNNKKYMVYKLNYKKYPDFYNLNIQKTSKHNKCVICEKEYFAYSMTCSKDCSKLLKTQSYIDHYGVPHNLHANSPTKKDILNNLLSEYGVVNVFQLDSVKAKSKLTLGADNPSYLNSVKIKRRITGEKNGTMIPLDQLSEFQIYKMHVTMCTNYNINKFGFKYWGQDFIKSWSFFENHVDHCFSIIHGFQNKISPIIIGNFSNLRFINYKINLKKGRKSSITKDELIDNYNSFLITEKDKIISLNEKIKQLIQQNQEYIKQTLKKYEAIKNN